MHVEGTGGHVDERKANKGKGTAQELTRAYRAAQRAYRAYMPNISEYLI